MDEFKNVDFVIGYLQQAKRMKYNPDKIVDIIIFLCEEIGKLKRELEKR